MIIFDKGNKTYPFDATRTFDFKRWNDHAGDFALIEGFLDFRGLDEIRNKKIVHLEFEDPNRFFSSDPLFLHTAYEDYIAKVFTICPYTAKWLNAKYGNDKRTFAFIPFNENLIPAPTEKEYDIIYAGHILSPELEEAARILSKFDYRLVAPATHPLSTNPDANYAQKIGLVSKSRITLVHSVLFLEQKHIRNLYKNAPDFRDNEAYKMVPNEGFFNRLRAKIWPRQILAPQVKSRLFDAAFCRSLILCRRDPWNVIERFFAPGKEFVYYEPGRLEEKIREILADYDSYKPIIDRAYERATKEYTTKAFFEKYLKTIQ